MICADSTNWDLYLDDIETTINATPNRSTGESPHFILHGYAKRLPIHWDVKDPQRTPIYNYESYVEQRTNNTTRIITETREALRKSSLEYKRQYDKKSGNVNLRVGQTVYIIKHVKDGPMFKADNKFEGPYRIIGLLPNNKCKVKHLKEGTEKETHWNHIKLVEKKNITDEGILDHSQVLQPENSIELPVSSESTNDGPAQRTRAKTRNVHYDDDNLYEYSEDTIDKQTPSGSHH